MSCNKISGAFLIPYVVMMFLEGMPLFLIEMGIGQKMRSGPVGLLVAFAILFATIL